MYGVRNLIGFVVTEIIEGDTSVVNVLDGLGRQDYDTAYSIGLQTDAGACFIVYRNSSNGYYGGWIQRVDGTPADLVEIHDDWIFQNGKAP